MTSPATPASRQVRRRLTLVAVMAVTMGLGVPLAIVLSSRTTSHNDAPTMTGAPVEVSANDAVATPSPAAGDERIAHITRLVGKTKEDVVRTLGPPTDFLYISGMYTYQVGEFQAFMKFFDPERSQSHFNTQTRGAAATLSSLSLRFNAAWASLSLPTVLRSIGAPELPSYILIDRDAIREQLLNRASGQREFHVAFGGVQDTGYVYEVLVRCAEPPLTGQPTFDYATNRQDIHRLTPNSSFQWSRCSPLGVRMSGQGDWKAYDLASYDDSLGAHGLHERIALDGTALPAPTP
jgi:hypothetical protein